MIVYPCLPFYLLRRVRENGYFRQGCNSTAIDQFLPDNVYKKKKEKLGETDSTSYWNTIYM